MLVALVYPPTCDPTAPYLAVPMLAGFLRREGIDVLPIDANVEAFDRLLSPASLGGYRDKLEARLHALDGRASLSHAEQLEYAALVRARGDAHAVPSAIAQAKATLRDEARFFDRRAYAAATATVDAALRVVSAAHHPLHLDFTAYRTPFGLTTLEEIERASSAENDPFHGYLHDELIPKIRASGARLVGVSVCFPGQLQPAYAFGIAIKRALPDVHVTCGGPGVTQMLIRLEGQRLARALGPFDSACVFEGEHTLTELARAIDDGRPLRGLTNVVVRDKLLGARYSPGHGMVDLKALPSPDFDGMPLERYLSPKLVLPYDPTRGCYWGKCTFCHYGLAEVGTAAYRERDVEVITGHVRALAEKYATRHFYFSQDSVAPKTLVKLAERVVEDGLDVRWATDLKPEKYLTKERAELLGKAGAVACALGVESASPRVLKLIDKGAPIEVVGDVLDRLASAGIAPEAMCFTEFPTETADEALATLEWLADRRDEVGLYIVGEFGLTHGSLVAQDPARFGIRETFELEGDHFGLGLFFDVKEPWKSDDERAELDDALAELSSGWALRTYPWAGAVSTAHSILYYDRFGRTAFHRDEPAQDEAIPGARAWESELRFDWQRAERAAEHDAQIWSRLVYEERRIGRALYEELATQAPRLLPRATRVRFEACRAPVRVAAAPKKAAPRTGKRPSHATNVSTAAPRKVRAKR